MRFLRWVWNGRRPHPVRTDEERAHRALYGTYAPRRIG